LGLLSSLPSGRNFATAEILALDDLNWSLSKLKNILNPLSIYLDSKDWSALNNVLAQENKDRETHYSDEHNSVQSFNRIKKLEKFYAQDDFYTPAQTSFLIKQHNKRVESLYHLISAAAAFLLGGGLLFFRRQKQQKDQAN